MGSPRGLHLWLGGLEVVGLRKCNFISFAFRDFCAFGVKGKTSGLDPDPEGFLYFFLNVS